MSHNGMPAEHPDPELDRLRPYITDTAVTLREAGIELDASWLDPCAPRDATIRIVREGEKSALVWDEETGWRVGGFVSGEPGERTRLRNARYLGGGLLPDPKDVARRLLDGTEEPCTKVRSYDEDTAAFNATLPA